MRRLMLGAARPKGSYHIGVIELNTAEAKS